MNIDFNKVIEKAESYKPAISRFLRDMVAIPSESCQEARVIQRIKQEMEAVGFDRVDIDPMGNVLGHIGHGEHLVAIDAHIDTVGVGNVETWEHDPFEGYEDDEIIVGRGTSDQEGGDGRNGLCCQDYQGPQTGGGLYPADDRHRSGRRL